MIAFRRGKSQSAVLKKLIHFLNIVVIYFRYFHLDKGFRPGNLPGTAKINQYQFFSMTGHHDVFRFNIQVQNSFLFGDKFHDLAQIYHKEQNLILIFQYIFIAVTQPDSVFLLTAIILISNLFFLSISKGFPSAQFPVLFPTEFVQIPSVDKFFHHTEILIPVDHTAFNFFAWQAEIPQIFHNIVDADNRTAFPKLLKNLPFHGFKKVQPVNLSAV